MVDPGLVVRPARTGELDAAGALCEEAYDAAGQLSDDDGYRPTLRDAAARAAAGPVLVAVLDGALVGTATLCPAGTAFAELARPGELEVRFLAVAPSAWGQGIGPALVAAAEAAARADGAAALVLFVIERNAVAHRMYRRLGFRRVPDRDWEPVPGVVLQAYLRPVPSGVDAGFTDSGAGRRTGSGPPPPG